MSSDEISGSSGSFRGPRLSLRWALIAGVILFGIGGYLLRVNAPTPEPIVAAPDLGISVDTLVLAPSALQRRVRVSGMIHASRRVELFSEQDGRV